MIYKQEGTQVDANRTNEKDESNCTTCHTQHLYVFCYYFWISLIPWNLVFIIIQLVIVPPTIPFLQFFNSCPQNTQICINNVCWLIIVLKALQSYLGLRLGELYLPAIWSRTCTEETWYRVRSHDNNDDVGFDFLDSYLMYL